MDEKKKRKMWAKKAAKSRKKPKQVYLPKDLLKYPTPPQTDLWYHYQ